MAPQRAARRTEALSRERIVSTAVELLDTAGESGLTFRTLTERLATGPGAVYHHVASKEELLGAATDAVIAAAVAVEPAPSASAADRLRAVALALFDTIDEHPWLATQLSAQLSRSPGGSVAPRLLEGLGRQVRALGVPEDAWFSSATALMSYVLGAAGQNAVNGTRARAADLRRTQFLDATASAWEALDPDAYPFTRGVADQLREHDDREQFLAGIDFLLAGIAARHPIPASPDHRAG